MILTVHTFYSIFVIQFMYQIKFSTWNCQCKDIKVRQNSQNWFLCPGGCVDKETACKNDRQRERGATAPLVYFAKYKTETVSIFTHIPFSNGRFPISLEYKELMLSKSEPRLSLYFFEATWYSSECS